MSGQRNPSGVPWPLDPDVNAFAQKGASDGRLLNAGETHLQGGLEFIRHRAQADLLWPDSPARGHRYMSDRSGDVDKKVKRARLKNIGRGVGSGMGWTFRLAVLIAGAILGVGITETAFYIFHQSIGQTRLITVAVELLFIYSAYVIGSRMRNWRSIGRMSQAVTIAMLTTMTLAALAIVKVRAGVIGLDLDKVSASENTRIAMFSGLALLLIVAAIDAGLHGLSAQRKANPKPKLRVDPMPVHESGANGHGPDRPRNQHLERQTARHSQWMACQFAYIQAYQAAVAAELLSEVEAAKPIEIPHPGLRHSQRRAQGEPSREP